MLPSDISYIDEDPQQHQRTLHNGWPTGTGIPVRGLRKLCKLCIDRRSLRSSNVERKARITRN